MEFNSLFTNLLFFSFYCINLFYFFIFMANQLTSIPIPERSSVKQNLVSTPPHSTTNNASGPKNHVHLIHPWPEPSFKKLKIMKIQYLWGTVSYLMQKLNSSLILKVILIITIWTGSSFLQFFFIHSFKILK